MRLLWALLSIFICLTWLTGTGSVHAHPLTTRNVASSILTPLART